MKARTDYDWESMASVPHIIKPLEIDTTPKKKTLGSMVKEKKFWVTMPFGIYGPKGKFIPKGHSSVSSGKYCPALKIEDLPKSYIIWCLENVADLEEKWPGLQDRLTYVLERQKTGTLPDNEEKKR
jgi:hypothetical protein